MFIEKLNLERK